MRTLEIEGSSNFDFDSPVGHHHLQQEISWLERRTVMVNCYCSEISGGIHKGDSQCSASGGVVF